MAKYLLTADQYSDLDTGEYGDLRPDYSGRGMFGATCLGLTVDRQLPPGFVKELAKALAPQEFILDEDEEPDEDQLDELIDELGNPSSDSMGLSSIYYWRGIQVEGHAKSSKWV